MPNEAYHAMKVKQKLYGAKNSAAEIYFSKLFLWYTPKFLNLREYVNGQIDRKLKGIIRGK